MLRFSYVYLMGNSSRRALYTGVAASLYKRAFEHKSGQGGYFSAKYKCHRLVYFEQFTNIEAAILREKQIKGWSRAKKNILVEAANPGWKDLARELRDRWESGRFSFVSSQFRELFTLTVILTAVRRARVVVSARVGRKYLVFPSSRLAVHTRRVRK